MQCGLGWACVGLAGMCLHTHTEEPHPACATGKGASRALLCAAFMTGDRQCGCRPLCVVCAVCVQASTCGCPIPSMHTCTEPPAPCMPRSRVHASSPQLMPRTAQRSTLVALATLVLSVRRVYSYRVGQVKTRATALTACALQHNHVTCARRHHALTHPPLRPLYAISPPPSFFPCRSVR